LIKPLRRKRILGNENGNENGNGNGNGNGNENGNEMEMKGNENENEIDMHCVFELHDMQCAPVDTINRDKERSKPKRQHNGVRDAKVPKRQKQRRTRRQGAGWVRRWRLRPLLLASTTKSAHTDAGWSHTKELVTSWHGRPLY
jgi:hypothetical protein